MTILSNSERRDVAVDIVRNAGKIALRFWTNRDDLQVSLKGDNDFLTVADGIVENYLREQFKTRLPKDRFVGEEGGGELHDEGTWVVDPIDGTSNFAAGLQDWCISAAYMKKGMATIGIVYAPTLEEMFIANSGEGATCNGRAMHVSDPIAAGAAIVDTDWSPGADKAQFISMTGHLMDRGIDYRRPGSAALSLARVASGRRNAYIEYFSRPWDVLAGLVLVREAGGWSNRYEDAVKVQAGGPVMACCPAMAKVLEDITRIIVYPPLAQGSSPV